MPVRERKPAKKPGKTEGEPGKGLAGLERQLRKLGAPLTQAAGVVSFAYACHWQMNVVKVRILKGENVDLMLPMGRFHWSSHHTETRWEEC